jgi:superfamily II DNA or RNA helicase
MTSIGQNGYSILKDNLSKQQIKNIRKDLTVKPFINSSYASDNSAFAIYAESNRKLYLPRFYGVENYGNTDHYKIAAGTNIDIKFKGSLKAIQYPIVDAYFESIKDKYIGGGLISVPCGYGKTVLALYIAAKLKLKTLVIVHKEFLLNQWKERIEQFLEDCPVGLIQRQKIDIDKPIVMGLLQSISMIDYDEDLFKGFGLVIYDECHHLGAEVFSKALMKTSFRYTLGLSATPKRTDGLSKVFSWYLGPMIYCIKKRETENVDVCMYHYFDKEPSYSRDILNIQGKLNLPLMINNITTYVPRINFIVSLITECLKENRKILLLSDRKNHLGLIKQELDKITEISFTSGYYLGGMKQALLEKTEKDNVILGTFAMASEGFDCREPLDTIILASPKSSIEQSIGRILRQDEKDRIHVPLVIDIVDDFSMFQRQAIKRAQFYKKNKYNMNTFDKNKATIINRYIKQKEKPIEFHPDSD